MKNIQLIILSILFVGNTFLSQAQSRNDFLGVWTLDMPKMEKQLKEEYEKMLSNPELEEEEKKQLKYDFENALLSMEGRYFHFKGENTMFFGAKDMFETEGTWRLEDNTLFMMLNLDAAEMASEIIEFKKDKVTLGAFDGQILFLKKEE